MNFTTIALETAGGIARVTFNRPEIHNAFNSTLITEMAEAFRRIENDNSVRLVLLSGAGKSFCAGADLNWMKAVVEQTFEQNLAESMELADVLFQIYSCSKPVIGRINGAAIGGGTGFVAVCDIAVAADSAKFSFSEVKIGLVPACIGPYVIKKLGEGKSRELFITGERMTAVRAHDVGLVNAVVADEQLDDTVNALIKTIMSSGPKAVTTAKELVSTVPGMMPEQFKAYTADMIARLRLSDEGQEGMNAFLNKRKPSWVDTTSS